MQYHPPFGATDPDAPWLNGVPGQQRGSAVDAKAVEYPMREIVNVILAAGMTPTDENLAQLSAAVSKLIAESVPALVAAELQDVRHYRVCGVYTDDDWLTAPPGFQPATGGVIQNAMTFCPRAWEYLQTAEGQQLRISESAWQAARAAAPWNGVGGVKKFVQDTSAGTIRLPDLRGMYKEVAGYDGLDVAMTRGDAMREISGRLAGVGSSTASFTISSITGAFGVQNYISTPALTSMPGGQGQTQISGNYGALFKASNVVPTASRFRPASWGALACVYLGRE